MKLSLSLLQDCLSFKSDLCNNGNAFSLIRYTFLLEETQLASGLVYLARGEDIPDDLSFADGAALMCIGSPQECVAQSGLPLLIFPESVDLIELAVELGAAFQRFNDLEKALNGAVAKECALQDLVDIVAPYLQNKITIVDANHLMLAHSYDDLQALDIPESDRRQHGSMVPVEIVGFFANNKRWVEARTETEPFIYDEGIFDHRLLCLNIIADGIFSWRVMLAESERPLKSYDNQLLVFFAGYVRTLYENMLVDKERQESNTLRNSLSRMLSGNECEPWQVRQVVSALGCTKDSQLVCICVRPEYWDDSTETISYYREQFARLFPGTIALEFKGDVVCLACLDRYGSSSDLYLASITPFIRDNNFRIGVSEQFEDILHLKGHYRQAEIALSYGIEETPSQWVHRFHEQAIRFILKQCAREPGVRALCAGKALRLHDYDAANQSSYVQTLERYLSNNLSIVKSAEDLKIHRATMVYRLKRIEEIAGMTFKDPAKNLFYHLSAKMLLMD